MAELHWNVVYGPVKSRRFGPSLGVNLQPPDRKICTFNCAYCQYGWTRLEAEGKLPPTTAWPKRAQIARTVERELAARRPGGGHRAPDRRRPWRTDPAPGVPPRRARPAGRPRPRGAVAADCDSLELDDARPPARAQGARPARRAPHEARPGDDETLQRINGSAIPVEKIVSGLKKLHDVRLQAMFITDRNGRLDNTGQETVSRWLVAVKAVKPREVHLYTIDQQPAFPFLRAVSATSWRRSPAAARLEIPLLTWSTTTELALVRSRELALVRSV